MNYIELIFYKLWNSGDIVSTGNERMLITELFYMFWALSLFYLLKPIYTVKLENFSNLITAGGIHYEEIIAQVLSLKWKAKKKKKKYYTIGTIPNSYKETKSILLTH